MGKKVYVDVLGLKQGKKPEVVGTFTERTHANWHINNTYSSLGYDRLLTRNTNKKGSKFVNDDVAEDRGVYVHAVASMGITDLETVNIEYKTSTLLAAFEKGVIGGVGGLDKVMVLGSEGTGENLTASIEVVLSEDSVFPYKRVERRLADLVLDEYIGEVTNTGNTKDEDAGELEVEDDEDELEDEDVGELEDVEDADELEDEDAGELEDEDAGELEDEDVGELEVEDADELEDEDAGELEDEDVGELEDEDVGELEDEDVGELEVEDADELEVEDADELEVEDADELEVEDADELEVEDVGELEDGEEIVDDVDEDDLGELLDDIDPEDLLDDDFDEMYDDEE